MTCRFESNIGEYFVGVHIGGGASASLIPVDEKLIVILASQNLIRGLLNCSQPRGLHCADICISLGCRKFYDRPCFHEAWIVVDQNSRELEVLQCSRGLYSIVGISWDFLFPQEVLFNSRLA